MFQRAPPEVSGLGVMHLDALAEQVVPGRDLLGVAGADDEDDHRIGDHAVVFVGVPVLGHQPRLDQAGDVRLQREGHDVGRQPALDGPALLARGRERCLED